MKVHVLAGSIISYVRIYFCSVKPAGALAQFFYQVPHQLNVELFFITHSAMGEIQLHVMSVRHIWL